ncbi:uncharacterized protein LOC102353636 [Latimeria chalumnae]|uniref:uncharacterized protein LOC102353636 n=1 Tax=Latimeria chalumnae TaxID=7897 RepID=UPI00313BC3C2
MASWENGRKTAATDLCFDILEANSPANQYLVQLLESKKEISIQEPTESRMKFLFQLLDNLLPKLGVFSRVVKLIRDELYEAVYSFQITADPQPKSETADMVTRVPYFSLFRRIQDERNEEAEKLQSELDCIRELFSERDNELLQLKLTVSEMQNCSETFISTITNLKNELEKKNEEITRINENYQFQEKEKAEQARLYESTITKLQSLLQVTQDQVTSLKQYKKIYDGLQEAFQYPIGKKKKNAILAISSKSPTNRRAIVATKKAHLYSYLEATKHLKYQLLQVQNAVIEDFDVFMEKHRQQLLSKKLQESVEVPDKKEECKEKQRTFQQSIMDISVELNLLNKHSESLQQQLKELETIQHKSQTGYIGPTKFKMDLREPRENGIENGHSATLSKPFGEIPPENWNIENMQQDCDEEVVCTEKYTDISHTIHCNSRDEKTRKKLQYTSTGANKKSPDASQLKTKRVPALGRRG